MDSGTQSFRSQSEGLRYDAFACLPIPSPELPVVSARCSNVLRRVSRRKTWSASRRWTNDHFAPGHSEAESSKMHVDPNSKGKAEFGTFLFSDCRWSCCACVRRRLGSWSNWPGQVHDPHRIDDCGCAAIETKRCQTGDRWGSRHTNIRQQNINELGNADLQSKRCQTRHD